MSTNPTQSLVGQVAAIQAGFRSDAARLSAEAGVVAALHVLILAALAQLCASLEHMLAAWKSGDLAPPASAKAPTGTPVPSPARPPEGHVRQVRVVRPTAQSHSPLKLQHAGTEMAEGPATAAMAPRIFRPFACILGIRPLHSKLQPAPSHLSRPPLPQVPFSVPAGACRFLPIRPKLPDCVQFVTITN